MELQKLPVEMHSWWWSQTRNQIPMLKKKMPQIITRIKHTSTMNMPFHLKQINIKNKNTS